MEAESSSRKESIPGKSGGIRSLLTYLGIWLVALTVLVILQTSWGNGASWQEVFGAVLRNWLPWVVLGPVLWWLVKRFPLFGSKKWRNLAVHFAASLVMLLLAELLVAFVVHPATRPIFQQAAAENPQIREVRSNRRGPQLRQREYRLRPKPLARKFPAWFLLNWLFVLIGNALLQRRADEARKRRNLELQNELSQARLRELQNRLQPHFLFNTLNSVSALILVDPEKADDMVNRLSQLLRRVLQSSEKPLIPLREELDLLRDYLAIEQVRFSDRLSVQEFVEEETLGCLLPPLALQPLAENAIKHGIEPKSEPSVFAVHTRIQAGLLHVQLIDDGIGGESKDHQGGFGIGTENVRRRLETAFPGEATLEVKFPDGGGTAVSILVPVRKGEVNE